MAPQELSAIHQEERVTRSFPARPRERELAAEPSHPLLEVRSGARGPAFFGELGARLDPAFEQRLCEPFTRIRTIARALEQDVDDRHAEPAGAIREAAQRAEAMTHDILDFLRCVASGLGVVKRRVDLTVVCERVVDAVHAEHPDRPMLLTSDPRVDGQWDPDRIATLVAKLVLGALEYGPTRPAIRVELRATPDKAILHVWNAGVLDAETLASVFEPFVLRGAGRPTGREGAGLGFFLAREIARAHGGRIEAQSSKAEGTTFRVTLPR
jgi:signal transduction histidine kinase